MKIQFDETNLLAEMVGENDGVGRAEVAGSTAMAAARFVSFRNAAKAETSASLICRFKPR